MAQAYNGEKEYAKALDVVQRGLEVKPNSAVLLAESGVYLQLQKEYPAAIRGCEEGSKAQRKYFYPYLLLARIELDLHEYEKAEVNARKVVEMGEDSYEELRDALMGLKRYQDAIQALNKALEKTPDNATILVSLAIVYHEGLYDDPSGYEQAYELNEKAYRLNPKTLSIRENLAEASLTAGHYDEAFNLANAVLTDPSLLSEDKLSMKLITIAALMCQRNDANAFAELSEFIRYYESIQQDYERSWIFQGTRSFVAKNKSLRVAERNLLLKLINKIGRAHV